MKLDAFMLLDGGCLCLFHNNMCQVFWAACPTAGRLLPFRFDGCKVTAFPPPNPKKKSAGFEENSV
jgi:hypothetical protein